MNGDGSSGRSMTYSLPSLFKLINQQDAGKGNELAQLQQTLLDLKKNISLTSKKNFTLERDIRNLDKKIALLIRNKITIEEIMTNSGDLSLLNKTGQIKSKRDRELYGQLFWLLQNDTRYIATLARLVNIGQIDNLLQTVMFTLYGNQYDEYEEHLLLSMFRSVLDFEFQQATGIGSLLRANTALTRMMTTYTRRGPGQTYLKNTLTGVLTKFCNLPDVLEVNPLKVYIEYINDYEIKTGQKSSLNRKVTAEEAAENDEVQKIIKPRIEKLDEIAAEFIDALIKSADSVPYGIKWICKQISELVKDKFPDVTREQVCSLIGGFYLLRFINPAIVTPQAFMLVENKLSANTRRNLTLLAKILQNLANNVKFGGVKEFYMSPLNICIDKNKEKLNRFLEEMTHVENLEQHLNLDRYIALGRTEENSINISFNEMYFIHELLVTHKPELLKDDPSDHLKQLLDKLGDPPPQIARKDNANIDLVLSQSWHNEADSQGGKLAPEQIYAETKFLLFTIIKALPVEDMEQLAKQSLDETLLMAKKYAQQTSNKGLGESVKRINKNCADLVKVGYLNETDNYAQLRKDAVQELFNYEEQIEKTKSLIDRLQEVLKSVEQHKQFLTEQYDAYKSYLDDVRGKCAVNEKDKKGKAKKQKAAKVAGPYKYTYSELEKAGIIKVSQVPKGRRARITFSFSSGSPGMYVVSVSFAGKSLPAMSVTLELADLLERQQEGRLDYETEFLTLDVNLLLHLLNKHFVSGKGKS